MKSTETDDTLSTPAVIETVVNIGVTLVMAYVEICAVIGEDQTRVAKMTVLRAGENYCQSQAVFWARLANSFRSAYDRLRMVS